MNHRNVLLAIGLSLMTLPAFAQGFVSSEKSSDNPMDGVGVGHNAYAGCMAANHVPGGKPSHVEVLVYRCGVPTDGSPEEFIQKHTEMAASTRPASNLSLAENVKAGGQAFSEEQFAYFEDVDKILATSINAEEADSRLKALEAQAVKYLGREDSDLTVLGAISTSRYSLELWTQDRPSEASSKRRFPWLEVVVADVSGFVSGTKACGGIKLCGYINAAIQSVSAALN